ncbi:MAG: phnB, partial [Chthoniobacteraceae bacterium]|nr:phnB [Chthoniobacteraceae bacterium]
MINPLVQIFLNFDGRCEEAVEFYRTALNAKVDTLMRFKENPEAGPCAPSDENKILY